MLYPHLFLYSPLPKQTNKEPPRMMLKLLEGRLRCTCWFWRVEVDASLDSRLWSVNTVHCAHTTRVYGSGTWQADLSESLSQQSKVSSLMYRWGHSNLGKLHCQSGILPIKSKVRIQTQFLVCLKSIIHFSQSLWECLRGEIKHVAKPKRSSQQLEGATVLPVGGSPYPGDSLCHLLRVSFTGLPWMPVKQSVGRPNFSSFLSFLTISP